jgi:hypothetical protein
MDLSEYAGFISRNPIQDEIVLPLPSPPQTEDEAIVEEVGRMFSVILSGEHPLLSIPLPSPPQTEDEAIFEEVIRMFSVILRGEDPSREHSPQPTRLLEIEDQEVTDETRALECRICTVNKICIVLSKCGHTFCNSCTIRLQNKCAVCRTEFNNSTKIQMFI